MKNCLVFDLDGTLVDTAPDLMTAHNYVMKKYGYEEKPLESIRHLAGRGAAAMLIRSIDAQGNLIKKNPIDSNSFFIFSLLSQSKTLNCFVFV